MGALYTADFDGLEVLAEWPLMSAADSFAEWPLVFAADSYGRTLAAAPASAVGGAIRR